jgi:putative ABC transport system permease protein
MGADDRDRRALLFVERGVVMGSRWRAVRAWLVRVGGSLGLGAQRDAGFEEEMAAHLAMHVEDNMRAGMSPVEARRAALIKLGGVAQTRELYRDRRGVPIMDHLAQDLRYAVRTLRQAPGFALIVILTLGLGVGANAAIFSIVNAVLLRPLPYPDADRLVMVYATNPRSGSVTDVTSYPEFEDWKAQNRSFDHVAAFTARRATVSNPDANTQAEMISAAQVTPGFFETLGVTPAIGRTFEAGEEAPGTHLVILSDSGWRRYFSARPDVIGQTMRIGDDTYTVIGVMPSTFAFLSREPEQLYTPQPRETSRGHGYLRVLARLRPEVTRAQAQSDMDVIARRISDQYKKPTTYLAPSGVNVMPLLQAQVGVARTGLLIFMGVVVLVLLIACTNVANLMLVRNVSRQKELAMRAALGAGRWRLLQQLLTESLVLAIAGGMVGLLLASATAPLLANVLAAHFPIPRVEATRTDVWVMAFTGLVSLLTVLVFGGVHAHTAGSRDLQESLRTSTRSGTEHVAATRIRRLLVLTEIALALILLAGAGALLKSLLVLYGTSPGFSTERVLAVDVFMPQRITKDDAPRIAFLRQVVDRVTAIPQVQSAAFVTDLPLGGGFDHLSFHIIGRPDPPPAEPRFNANVNPISADYFRTLSIPILAGREFTERDTDTTPRVIVINEATARRYWPGEDPIGKQITIGNQSTPLTIVGVVGDVRQQQLGVLPVPEIFVCSQQPSVDWPWRTLVVRTRVDPAAVAPQVRRAVESVDRGLPILRLRTLDEVMGASLAEPRVYASLLGIFAALALLLAAVGLYGVMSYTVSQRTHEMGIRMALGAGRGDVIRLVLRQALGLALIGTTIGLVGAIAVAKVLTTLIPTAKPTDPLTLAAVSALLLASAFLAGYGPARRGSRVDPMIAVRESN